jgi:hypothetical protein
MQQAIFAVGDEPYLLWEEDLSKRTRDFLEGLDPDFFSYVLHAHMETEDEKRASVAIRLALHHATETMFSLLGAFVQAPDCPYAWIARCSNTELRGVVKRISEGDRTLLSKFKMTGMGWEPIASVLFSTFEPGSERQRKVVDGFSRLWRGLAGELLTEVVIEEYNATKHGFRTRPGGFKIEFAAVKTPDVPPTDAEMTLLGESKFGAMFYKIEKMEGSGGRHLCSRQVATNWSLERDILLLQLAQLSIQNTVSALKIANKAPPSTCKFAWPSGDDDFSRPWTHSPGVTNMTFPSMVDPTAVPTVTKAELLKKLRQALGGNV